MLFLTKKKYIDAIMSGEKKVDLRRADGPWKKTKAGDRAVFVCGRDVVRKTVKEVIKGNLGEITSKVSYKEIVPWAKDGEDFLRNIREIYPDEKEFIAYKLED